MGNKLVTRPQLGVRDTFDILYACISCTPIKVFSGSTIGLILFTHAHISYIDSAYIYNNSNNIIIQYI